MTFTTTRPTSAVDESKGLLVLLNQEAIDGPHGKSLFKAYQLWNAACERHNAQIEWFNEHPEPERGSVERDDWIVSRNDMRQQLGFPPLDCKSGQLWNDGHHHYLPLRAPVRNPDTDEVVFGFVARCAHCRELMASTKHERYCSAECVQAVAAKQKADDKAWRQECRAELSDALASRHGVCLCCGTDFNLKRTTAKVCSERCKKQVQRKPQLIADQLTDQLPELNDSYKHWKEQLELARGVIFAAVFGRAADPERVKLAEKIREDFTPLIAEERIKRCLHSAADVAPALVAWLLQQPEKVVESAFGSDRNYVLGSSLDRKLRREGLVN